MKWTTASTCHPRYPLQSHLTISKATHNIAAASTFLEVPACSLPLGPLAPGSPRAEIVICKYGAVTSI